MLKKMTMRAAIWALFFAYILLMIWLLFLRRTPRPYAGYNFIPLKTVRLYIGLMHGGYDAVRSAVVNLAGNVVMFIPLGFLLPAVRRRLRKFGWFLVTVAAAVAAVELLQLATGLGSCDIDDLLLNVFGAALGYGIFHLLAERRCLARARGDSDVSEHV